MKREWIKILLIASLAFNIAFVSMAIYKRAGAIKSAQVVDIEAKNNFNLEKGQKEELLKIMGSFRAVLTSHKSDILEKRIDIIEGFGDPEFSTKSIMEDINLLNEIENKLNTDFAKTLFDINSILDSKQWLKFLYGLSRSWFFTGMDTGK